MLKDNRSLEEQIQELRQLINALADHIHAHGIIGIKQDSPAKLTQRVQKLEEALVKRTAEKTN
jgi:hypothetical protein